MSGQLGSVSPSVQAPQGSTKVLILGGLTGMLGQALFREAQARGWQTHALGSHDGSILDYEFMEKRIADIAPDYIFNALAYTAVDEAELRPEQAMALNRFFPSMLGKIVSGSTAHLIHYSTDYVFSGKKGSPYTEDDSPMPLNVYGASKLAGENLLLGMGLGNCCIIRTAWLYGPGKRNFISAILEKAASSAQLTVVHDQVGSPTYTVDLAQISLTLAALRYNGLLHVANSGHASWNELASEAVAQSNYSTVVQPITSSEWPQRAKRPAYSVLATSRLTRVADIHPRPWRQALRDYLYQMNI